MVSESLYLVGTLRIKSYKKYYSLSLSPKKDKKSNVLSVFLNSFHFRHTLLNHSFTNEITGMFHQPICLVKRRERAVCAKFRLKRIFAKFLL
jgi:hypothetical protein